VKSEEFRKYGHEVVDWIADYLANVGDYPVLPAVKPGQLTAALPAAGPETGEPMERILDDFRTTIIPAVTHWNHPRFMAYFSVSASGPGILGEMLSAALNVNGMVWKSCPAVVELEQVTLAWLRDWMGLPGSFFGCIYDTASTSSMHAVAAAREMADPDARIRGGRGGLVMYTSEHSHSSVEKGAIAAGIGQENVRKVPTDSEFRMDVNALRSMVEADGAAGKKPFCVVATAGTTSTTSVDPIPPVADIAEQHGMWLHVDAAYAGPAAIIPEFRWLLDGAERAHSLVMNPHKWLFTPIDISAFYTSRPDILSRAFSLIPEYLKTAADPKAVNLMDYGVPLGRRFRALKLWFVLRYYGREGIVRVLREHIRWAQELAKLIAADPDFEIAAPHPLSLVCFRYRGSDADNRRLMDAVNATGKVFLSHTVLNGRFVIRLAIGNIGTAWEDVVAVWSLVKQIAAGTQPSD
jgi:aromatic-L-amino-acid decarboxylase